MRIGIICEGETDYFAIKNFLGAALLANGVDATFVDLQPIIDATQSEGGWGNIHRWLTSNPPAARVRRYFGQGLFEDDLDAKACDVFFVQMDCDHIADSSFVKFNLERYEYDLVERSSQIEVSDLAAEVLALWCGLIELNDGDKARHIIAPAEQSTESWCIGAFRRRDGIVDSLRDQELVVEFMNVIHESENRRSMPYTSIDKNIERRQRYCEKHASGYRFLLQNSPSFIRAFDRVRALNI